MSSLSNDRIENHDFQFTADMKERIIQDGGRTLDFYRLSDEDASKVTDDHAIRLIEEDVKAEDLTYIGLYYCTAITDEALHWIAQRCPQLETLFVNGCNKVTDVGISAISEKCNKTLEILSFSGCNKVTDGILDIIATHCTGLEHLYADNCGIRSLPKNIGNLQHLQKLYLSDNQITELPRSIIELKDTCKDFYIDINPLQYPPLAVATQGLDAIERCFKDIDDQGSQRSNKLKVVVIGDAEAGKTSLINLLNLKLNALMKPLDRTIYLELGEVSVPLDDKQTLKLMTYDCGGQEQYASGQAPYLNASALYLFVISAEKIELASNNRMAILRFFILMQASAPGAQVQIVISKTDMVSDTEAQERAKWVMKIVRKYNEKYIDGWRKLNIQEDPIYTSVKNASQGNVIARLLTKILPPDIDVPNFAKNLHDGTRRRVLDEIVELTKSDPPKLPTVGMTIPNTWIPFQVFVFTVRDHGFPSNTNEDKRDFVELLDEKIRARSLLDTGTNSDKGVSDVNNNEESDGDKKKTTEVNHQATTSKVPSSSNPCGYSHDEGNPKKRKFNSNDKTNFIRSGTNQGHPQDYILQRPTKKRTKRRRRLNKNECNPSVGNYFTSWFGRTEVLPENPLSDSGSSHCTQADLIKLWEHCVGELNGSKEEDDAYIPKHVSHDVLNLLCAQGDIFIDSGQVVLKPDYFSVVMRPLIDHTMTKDNIESGQYDYQINDFVDENNPANDPGAFEHIKNAWMQLVHTGSLDVDSDLLPFLWRDVPELLNQDYEVFIAMLKRSGVLLETMNKAAESKLMVMNRLPSDPDLKALHELVWLTDCPENVKEFSMRIEFPAGCPPSLAAHIAAYIHRWGRCLYAWLKGAVVIKDANKYRAELIEKEGENGTLETYILITARIKKSMEAEMLDEVTMSMFKGIAKKMEMEQKVRLPGILYTIKFPCPNPHCLKPSITWDLQKDRPQFNYCPLCQTDINESNMAGFSNQNVRNEDNNFHNNQAHSSSPSILSRKLPAHLEAGLTKCLAKFKHLDRQVLIDIILAIRNIAMEGTGENTVAKGIFCIIGKAEVLMTKMREDDRTPKFGKLLLKLGDIAKHDYLVRDFFYKDETKRALRTACKEDGGIVIDSDHGKICAFSFRVSDLGHGADGVGGTKSTAASSIAMQAGGCVSITVSEDDCTTVDKPRDNPEMKLFFCDSNPIKAEMKNINL